jgi:hypothetical protein
LKPLSTLHRGRLAGNSLTCRPTQAGASSSGQASGVGVVPDAHGPALPVQLARLATQQLKHGVGRPGTQERLQPDQLLPESLE